MGSLLLNGFDAESGSDDLIRSFESGSGQVAASEDFADAFDIRSVQTVPNYIGTDPVETPSFELSTADEPATVAVDQDKTAGDYIGDIFGNLWSTLKTTATAAAQGAVEGATAASQGAETGSTIGAKATTIGTSVSTTTLLLGALVLILILRR